MTHLGGVEHLRDEFNDRRESVRVLSVLSPTCPHCLEGYELVSHMDGAVVSLVLWTAMLEGDCVGAASALIVSDRRSSHYWENDGWPVSTRLRPLLGFGPYDPEMSVWDCYLLYRPGIVWSDEEPPVPTDWAHNLRRPPPGVPRISAALLTEWTTSSSGLEHLDLFNTP